MYVFQPLLQVHICLVVQNTVEELISDFILFGHSYGAFETISIRNLPPGTF